MTPTTAPTPPSAPTGPDADRSRPANDAGPSTESVPGAKADQGGLSRLPRGVLIPSATIGIRPGLIAGYRASAARPRVGDVVYGTLHQPGHHPELESRSGRLHRLTGATRSLFVYGTRYATDAFDADLPERATSAVDLVARSGLVGRVRGAHTRMAAPTTIRVLGRVYGVDGRPLNTLDHPLAVPASTTKTHPRARVILVVGTSMNAGKTTAASAIAGVLTSMGHRARASKITGTASLREIHGPADAGAKPVSDFTHLGYPSTHGLGEAELIGIFNRLDLKYGNNPSNYWICELADGVLQAETAVLLGHPELRSRTHRVVLCATDTLAAVGGVRALADHQLDTHLITGLATSSPLGAAEVAAATGRPTIDTTHPDRSILARVLLGA